jgi:AcrR family transcriptional regulator
MSVETNDAPVRRRMRGPARRAQIIEAATAVFASSGYGATGMAQIAEAAGVTRTVLYDHFPSKKALFLAVLEERNAVFLGHVGAQITAEGSAEERMRATMDSVFAFAERHPDTWRLLFGNATHGDPDVDAAWREVAGRRLRAVAALLGEDARAAGIQTGTARAEIMIQMLVSALSGAVSWQRMRRDATRADLVEAGMALMWTGLGPLRGT